MISSRRTRIGHRRWLLVIPVLAALVVAACGGGDDDDDAEPSAEVTEQALGSVLERVAKQITQDALERTSMRGDPHALREMKIQTAVSLGEQPRMEGRARPHQLDQVEAL